MLNSLTSSASVSVSRTTAAFETPYAENRQRGEVAPPPEKLMILPRPARIMCGNTDWQVRNGPNRFAENVFAHSFASTSQTRPIGPYVPAALTRISMRPNHSIDFRTKDATSGGAVTSVTTK